MAEHEVWNFVSKFFNLCNTGKNATLTLISSQHGKAVVNLQLDLYDVDPHPAPQPPRQKHPSPSRARRTQRRAVLKLELKQQLKMLLVSLKTKKLQMLLKLP